MHASAEQLRLITFDADGTLYADGAHMAQDNRMIQVRQCARHWALATGHCHYCAPASAKEDESWMTAFPWQG